MKISVFRVIVPYSLVEVYRRFKDYFCSHHQGNKYLIALIILSMGVFGYQDKGKTFS
jgi:hypothetical protein